MGMPQQSQRHQPQPHMGGAPAPGGIVQAPFKGTLAPGTRVQVGGLSVTVKRYLSEGEYR